MPIWMTGDLHVHSNHDADAYLPVDEVVRRARPMCDFIAVTGHARQSDNWGVAQHAAVAAARAANPGFFIFHAGEWEFPIERHTIVLTPPACREFELQRDLVRHFDRTAGVRGRDKALEGLRMVEAGWGDRALMIFNHPNHPPVAFDDLEALTASPVFRIIACYDRGERRAPQTWEVGAEWDRLLMRGHRIWVRFGSDFHGHFSEGHDDYYPGEFAQDQVLVTERSYEAIFDAYRQGRYFCTLDNLVRGLEQELRPGGVRIAFTCTEEVETLEIIGDGRILETLGPIAGAFDRVVPLPAARYYRLRGQGREKRRRYTAGSYRPVFMSNPIFTPEA